MNIREHPSAGRGDDPPGHADRAGNPDLAGRAGLAAVVAALVALATAYAWLTPPFEGPDSNGHFAYVAWLCDHRHRPPLDAPTAAISHELVLQPPLYYVLAAPLVCASGARRAAGLAMPNPHYPGLSHRATITPPDAPPGAAIPARLAALVSLAGAVLAVVATWGSVRALVPNAPALATATAAVVGLNPQFVFAAASITNDAWAAGTFATAVWLAVRARRRGGVRAWLAVGLAVGLATLAKHSNLAVAAPVGLVWLWLSRASGWREGARAAAAAIVGIAATAGYWYTGNVVYHGSLVPFGLLQSLVPAYVRGEPASFGKVLGEAEWFTRSYWGVFGYGVVAGGSYFRVVDVLVALALAGLAVALPWQAWRASRDKRPGLPIRPSDTVAPIPAGGGSEAASLAPAGDPSWAALTLAATWFAVVLGGILQFMVHTRLGNQGRLLFPAAPAIAILLVLGWQALVPARWRPHVLRAVPTVFAFLAIWQSLTLARAYAIPPAVAAPVQADRPLDARFDAGMVVVGADLPAGGAAVGGGTLPLTLYLKADAAIPAAKLLFVHLSAADDRRLGGFDGVPAGGRHATPQWRPGEVFADRYDLGVADVATDTLAVLSVGFYDPDSGARAALIDAGGRPAGDRAVIGHVMVHRGPPEAESTFVYAPASESESASASDPARPSAPASDPDLAPGAPVVTWSNGIVMERAGVETDAAGRPTAVTATWSVGRPVHEDLTVFLHLLDAHGAIVSQVDRRPAGGQRPTDTWTPGYRVRDVYRIPLADSVAVSGAAAAEGIAAGEAMGFAAPASATSAEGSANGTADLGRLIIGLYDAAGRRVPLAGGAADHAVLRDRAISARPTPGL